MRKIITISTQTISEAVFVCKKLPKTGFFVALLALLSFGLSGNVSAACTNMVMSNGTPLWNGNEYCTGYNPAPINAPIINYTGTCSATPEYSYKWEQNINGAGWSVILANAPGTRVSTVPGFNPPALFNTPAGSPQATYQWRLTIVDSANGNQSAQSSNFTVFISSQMTGSDIHTLTCANPYNGTIDLTVNGGLSGATYTWTASGGGVVPPAQVNNEDLTDLTPGNYNVVVSDGGCANLSYNVTITTANALNASITSTTNILCFGASTGAATVTPAGGAPSGSPTYTYAWTPSGGTGATASGLAAGSYTVQVTDGGGCIVTTSTTLTEPSTAVSASTTNINNVSCFGGSNGSANVTAGGGVGPYTYSWAPSGGTNATASGLAAGTYTATVTDANMCSKTSTVIITEPSAVTATTTNINNVSCNGGSNGSASVTAGGGTPGYTYSWSPTGGTGATATGLAAGTYTVTVTDANLCAKTSTVIITEPTQITATTSVVNNVTCNGGANGSATVTPAGGTPSYTYSWAPSGGTSATASGLVAGTYTVTVTDNNLCSTTATAVITQPNAVTGTTSVINNVSCNGGSNGQATVTASGGTGYGNYTVDYTVVFSTTNAVPNQTVTVEVEDGSSNIVATTGPINNDGSLPFGVSHSNSLLSFSGNNPPYTLKLSGEEGAGGTTSISANVICDYTNSIVASSTLNLTPLGGPQSNNTSVPNCYGSTPAYTYSWAASGGTAATTSNTLAAGTYTVTITDAVGCTGTSTVSISEPSAVTASTTSTAPTCPLYNNGTATVVASGGTPALSGYLFVLSNTFPGTPGDGTVTLYDGSNSIVYFNPSVTSFVSSPPIAITNPPYRIEFTVNQTSNGGLNTNKVEVFCEPNPVLTFATSLFSDCLRGSASPYTCQPGGYYTQILPSCGTPTYSYSWAPSGGTAATATGLSAGSYTVTVTDANSCTKTTTVTLTNSLVGPVHNTNTGINYCTIQAAINDPLTLNGHSITVDAGSYNEDVVINKSVSLTGAGCGLTTVSGPIGGGGATMQVAAAGVVIDGFTITRDGNTVAQWNLALNSAGISIQSQGITAEVRNCCIIGNRTGIDINNSNGNNIHNNLIDNNRTGMVFRNQTDNSNVQNNFVTNNWTAGILFLDAGGAPPQQALNSTFNNNNISGNWYGEVVDRQTNPTPGTNLKNFECNWYGATAMPTTSTANSTEPGYAAQIPVIFGGAAVAPGGQPDILGPGSANIDFTPWTIDGTDIAAATMGWQPTAGSCLGTPVVITIDNFRNERCGLNNGYINTTITGGSGTYTISWSPSGGTADDATGLAAGTYTITVTDGYGTTATKTQTLIYLPVTNSTQSKDYATIQAAIDDATTVANDVIDVCQGTYNEDVVINKSLTVNGPNANASCSGTRVSEANIIGLGGANTVAVKIAADGVTLNGFNISNPNGSYGVSEQGRSNVNVSYNIVSNVGNATSGVGPTYGIHAESNAPSSNINFTYNCVSDIRGGTNGCPSGTNGSGVGIGATSSNSTNNMTNLNISYNTISNISACNFNGSGGKGAYGVIINVGASAAGQAIDAIISNNEISNLNGRWAHAIGLEGKTPGALVTNNTISSLTSAAGDAIGVFVEQNAGVATVQIHDNSLTGMVYGVANAMATAVNASCNWYGSNVLATVTAANGGAVTFTPYLLSGTDTNPGIGFQPVAGCTAPCALVATMSSVTASCPTFNNGSATATVTGGTGSYTYLWTPGGQTTATATGLTAGTYSVSVTDVNGCSTMSSVVVATTYVPLANPTDSNSTVECLPSGLPTPPTVLDACGTTITPTGPVATGTYTGCEGTKIYTYTYTDAFGSSVDWVYTYTIDHVTAPVVPTNGAATVECASSATPPTSLPVVYDVCGTLLVPSTAVLNSIIKINFSTPVVLAPTAAPSVWYTDRYNPAGFANGLFGGDSVLIHSINAADGSVNRAPAFQPAFYNTQGRGFDYGSATTYAEAKLYIPSAWATSNKRMAGFWGVGVNASNAVTAYPIVEFTSDGNNPRFRVYNAGPFVDLGLPTGFAYDTWVTLSMQLLNNGQFIMKAGDKSYTTTDMAGFAAGDSSVRIKSAILQGHNYDATVGSVPGGPGVTYDIYWDNLKYNDAYTAPTCEGEMSYTYQYQDCAGLITPWTYTYTIDHTTAPVVPANGSSTVECLTSATAPSTPSVTDVCGLTVAAVLDSTIDSPSTLTCEGTRTYYYSYTDCSGLRTPWKYTYTIDHTTAPAELGVKLIGVNPFSPTVYQFNPTTLTQISSATLSLTGFTIVGGQAIDQNPLNGLYYAILNVGTPNRKLVTVDINTGVCTEIGNMGQAFSSLTFAPDGTLYAATGDGASPNPETLFKVNTATAATSLLTAMGNGNDGEVIAFNKNDGYIYHFSGLGSPVFEKIDTATFTITNIPLSGVSSNEIVGAVYTGANNFILSDRIENFYNITTGGVKSLILNHGVNDLRGLALVGVPTSSTVACASSATAPTTLPAVKDVCGNTLNPTPSTPTIGGTSTGCAGTKTYTYNYVDCSGLPYSWTYTYTISTPVPVALHCPNDTTIAPCQTQSAVNAAFAAWLAQASFTGGCDASLSNNSVGAPNAGGGSVTVDFTVFSSCEADVVCTKTFTVPGPIIIDSVPQINVTCNGANNGSATVYHHGGTGPYTYSWAPSGGSAATATGLAPATYTVTVTNNTGCSATSTITITQPAVLVATETHFNVGCNGANNGSATISATGGTAPYTGTGNFTGLAPGTYTYNVSDAKGCTSSVTVTITQPTAVVPVVTITSPISCNGAHNGSASVTVTGGNPFTPTIMHPFQYDYLWSTGGTGIVENLIGPGTHTITATDASGCIGTTTFTMTQPPALVATATVLTNVSCNGDSSGSAVVVVTGGTPFALPMPEYSINWTSGGTFLNEFDLWAATHTVTAVDANGCIATSTVTITQPSAIVVSASSTPILCNGGTSTVTIGATGGVAPYTGTGNFTVSAGTYTYTVTDANGCTKSTSITITQPSALVASSSATSILCNGGIATVTVSATGGTAPYTGTGNFTVTAGTYTYTVTDNNGCSTTTTITVNQPSVLAASSTSTSILCNGGSATVSVSATGGTAPYTGTGNFTVTAGTYTYTVTDNNGCSTTTTITVGQPTALSASSTSTSILCNGGSATVTVSATGGTAPYTGTGNFTVSAGTYTYTVTDNNGCSTTTTITVTQPSALVASSSATAIGCNGGTATVTVSATGGTAPYTGTGNFTVSAGTYTYTVTDDNGCSTTTSIVVGQPNSLVASSTSTAILCNGGSATVTVSATGGTAPYTGTGNFTVTAGTYTYTVTDFNGCSNSTTITVNEPTALSASSTSTTILCNGGSATVSVSATGGTAPYTGTGNFTVTAGTYTYTVTDNNGCSTTTSITVGEPTALSASSTSTAILCNGGSATVTVSATGGTAPYTGTGNFTVTAGTYTYTVTDDNGCSTTTTITVNQPSALVASSSATSILCNGGSATVTVSATGGTAPYTGTGNFTVTTGTYTYTVTDDNGCSSTTTITVNEPTALSASSTSTSILCNGGSATVTVSATGGTAPYTGTGNFTVTAGTYTYTVTDNNGCSTTTSITVGEPTALSASSTSTAILCNGGSATVTVSATGGTAPYTGTGNFTVTAGTYTYTVTDDNGCSTTTSITVNEPTALVASSSATSILCNGGSATVTVSATGGTAPYTGTGNFTVTTGTYTYTVTDDNGCSSTTTITVNEPTALSASSTSTSILCNGGSATVTVSATGGTAPYTGTGNFTVTAGTYTYTVTDDNGCSSTTTITVNEPTALSASSTSTSILCNGGSATVTVIATGGTAPYTGTGNFTVTAGTYTYTVTDNNGCSTTTSITVNEPTALVASSSATSIICNGGSATVTVSATGGTAPYTGTGNFTVTAGTYTYTVTDDNGCSTTTTITVTQPAVITMSSSPVACDSYTWNSNTYTTSGVHTATFTASNGCDSIHTINLTIKYKSTSTISHTASLTYTWPVNGQTYTMSGSYTGTIVGGNAVGCDSVITLNLTILGVKITSKVFLDGPFDGVSLMHDSLRTQGQIPSTEPYSGTPYSMVALGGPAGETAFAGYLADNGNNSIVDWVVLELRQGTLPNAGVIYNKRALVQRDGDIVAEDGVSPVVFSTAPAGNYYVSVKHRNHLGVMTNALQALTLGGATVDFTTIPLWTKPSIPALVNTPARIISGVQVLWAGDAKTNKNVKYNGASNDKGDITTPANFLNSVLYIVGSATPNNIVGPTYRPQDVNMDGVVKYNNTNADRLTILNTVGVGTPNAIYNQHTPD